VEHEDRTAASEASCEGHRVGRKARRRGTCLGQPALTDNDTVTSTINPMADLNIEVDPKSFFINANVTLDQHIEAQKTNLPRYLATLFTLNTLGVKILPKAKTNALAAAWCRRDHKLADNLLQYHCLFTFREVFKAVAMLDAARQILLCQKRLTRIGLSKREPEETVLGYLKNRIDNLNKLKPSCGSVTGAVARHIQRWTRTLSKQELEYFALHMPTDEWRKLADVVHFNETRDFPALPWFLPFCFGKDAPTETIVSKCRHLTNENVNTLIQDLIIPYAHLRPFKKYLNDVSKAQIASNEEKLDTILWYYEDLQCLAVDDIISERLRKGDQITLSYGKIMERLLFFHTKKPKLYSDLLSVAQSQLEKIKLSVESPVAVLGDASCSMKVAVLGDASRSMKVAFFTATILSSILTTIYSAKLTFFNEKSFSPDILPKTIEDVLLLASQKLVDKGSIHATALVPYYDAKEKIGTFFMVSDEEENGSVCIGNEKKWKFFELFKKYREEVYPAKLVFISFIIDDEGKHRNGKIYSKFIDAKMPDVLQVRENERS
jgi:hypothetical protein